MKLGWAVPVAATVIGAIGGGYLGNREGHSIIDEMEAKYKSLL